MDAIKIPHHLTSMIWTYDAEADVLYLSAGPSRPAVGIDVGDGLVLRYDETQREMVGLTILGLRDRLAHHFDVAVDDSHAADSS